LYYNIANKNKISAKERGVIILQRLKAELMEVCLPTLRLLKVKARKVHAQVIL